MSQIRWPLCEGSIRLRMTIMCRPIGNAGRSCPMSGRSYVQAISDIQSPCSTSVDQCASQRCKGQSFFDVRWPLCWPKVIRIGTTWCRMSLNFNPTEKGEVHTKRWMSYVHKPRKIWSVHDRRQLSNIDVTTNTNIPCPMTANHCLQSKGDEWRPRPKIAKGCTHATVYTTVQIPMSIERYA